MKVFTSYASLFLTAALFLIQNPDAMAQRPHNTGGTAESHRRDEKRDPKMEDEYRMSHLEGLAGDLIGIVLPQRILDMPISKGWWDIVEPHRVSMVDHTGSSASIRLLKSGSTVVNYKYKIVREGREVTESYPFTIRIHRIEPEVVSLPSTIYLGWDMSENLQNKIHMLPDFSESPVYLTLDDPKFADIDEASDGMRITGRKVGETVLYVETGNGLKAKTRVVIEIPELKDIDIKVEDKTLKPGEMEQAQLKIWPVRAEAYVTWKSDDPDIVSVDQNGLITAIKEGKTTIRVVADNGVKDSITIKVKKK